MRTRLILFYFFLLTFAFGNSAFPQAKAGWQVEWQKAVQAAKKEAQVTIYGGDEVTHPDILAAFNKAHPDIKVVTVSGHAEVIERIVAERRAGKYLVDVFAYGPNAARVAYLAKFLEPTPPQLILPEVMDVSKWYGGKHHYSDQEGKYIFIYEGTPSASSIAYNTKVVNPKELKSTWDVLNPKWVGKVGFFAYGSGGAIPTPVLMLYYNDAIGPEFLKRLFDEMKVTVSRDRRQATDWLARDKYSLCFMCRDIERAQKQGLPVSTFGPHDLKEGGELGGGNSSVIVLVNRAPHPNAAKVFLNWYLSREGQTVWQSVMNKKVIEPSNSMRIDIPKTDVMSDAQRIEGRRYPVLGFLDPSPVQKLYEELLTKAKPVNE
jgi:ABC-type Fe3+ transport system substrate-binding protein